MAIVQVVFWGSLAALLYVYIGYPALLRLLARLRPRPVRKHDITPAVSLVISAYNEARVIRTKIDNALALDYPSGLLEVVVISDASSDDTDQIVREYEDRGVLLKRQDVRKGKTAGLNNVVPGLSGEVVVFSDANAIYDRSAIRKLVRNFADPDVGCATGEARYVEGNRSAADAGERAYWNYEIQLKRLESAIGSMVGGDGAIYAIRKRLWTTLPENAINDFLNPLQIVAAGYRSVYEPEAICHEETAGGIPQEYRRRVRIVSRSWQAVSHIPGILNPFKFGFFALALVSHKVLRWLSAVFFASAFAGLIGISAAAASRAPALLSGVATVAVLAWFLSRRIRRLSTFVWYYAVISVASFVGVINGITGRVSGIWSTPRERLEGTAPAARLRPVVFTAILVIACSPFLAAAAYLAGAPQRIAQNALVVSIGVLAYVYIGYPLTLYVARWVLGRQVRRAKVMPTVCILITANDEEDVIEEKLRNTLDVDYPPELLEIMVASDGSMDATNRLVRAFAVRGVRLVEFRTRRGKMAAINGCVPLISSDIIVFSDANTFLDRQAISALVSNFADESVGAVSGDVVLLGDRASLGPSEDLYYRYERWLQRAESAVGSMVGVDGALYAIRRRLFTSPPPDTVLDDMAIPMSVAATGHRVVFEPDAMATEQGPGTAIQEFLRRIRISAGGIQYLIRADSTIPWTPQMVFSLIFHKALRWLTVSFAAVAFISAVRLSVNSRFFLFFVLAHLAVVAIGALGGIPALRHWRAIGLVHYFCLVQAATAVGLLRGLRNGQPVAWERFARAPIRST